MAICEKQFRHIQESSYTQLLDLGVNPSQACSFRKYPLAVLVDVDLLYSGIIGYIHIFRWSIT